MEHMKYMNLYCARNQKSLAMKNHVLHVFRVFVTPIFEQKDLPQ